MGFKQRDNSSKRAYSRISIGKRKKLIHFVMEQGMPIAKVIKKLGLKLTTARLILQKYKQTGMFPMRQFKKMGKMYCENGFQDKNGSNEIENDVRNRYQQSEIAQEENKPQPQPQIKQQSYPQYYFFYYYPYF